jgi:hypothetical protein
MSRLTNQEIAEGCVMSTDGIKRYFDDKGKLHRVGGPALIAQNGTKLWYQNGKRHRIDGPAAEWASQESEWYFEDQLIDCTSQEEFERLIKMKVFW